MHLRQLLEILACPKNGDELVVCGELLISKSGQRYPIVDGVPILIPAEGSLFSARNLEQTAASFSPAAVRRVSRVLPQLGVNRCLPKALEQIRETWANRQSLCLVVGAGDDEETLGVLRRIFDTVIVTDVVRAGSIDLVCDCAFLPLKNGSVDFVFCKAVLEHVLEPERVVAQVHRVLKVGGEAYFEVPFIQQVHMGPHDFTRFTHLGLRWLLRRFQVTFEMPVAGTGAALAWSIQYWLDSFFTSKRAAMYARAIARLLFWWLQLFDHITLQKPGTWDAAAG